MRKIEIEKTKKVFPHFGSAEEALPIQVKLPSLPEKMASQRRPSMLEEEECESGLYLSHTYIQKFFNIFQKSY